LVSISEFGIQQLGNRKSGGKLAKIAHWAGWVGVIAGILGPHPSMALAVTRDCTTGTNGTTSGTTSPTI